MSISRVDFQGTIMRTDDYTAQKVNEDNKNVTDQLGFQREMTKEVENKTKTVTKSTETEKDETERKFDAKDKGSNEYAGDGGKRRDARNEKGALESEQMKKLAAGIIDKHGKQVDLNISSGFDFKC